MFVNFFCEQFFSDLLHTTGNKSSCNSNQGIYQDYCLRGIAYPNNLILSNYLAEEPDAWKYRTVPNQLAIN